MRNSRREGRIAAPIATDGAARRAQGAVSNEGWEIAAEPAAAEDSGAGQSRATAGINCWRSPQPTRRQRFSDPSRGA
jgi:hypothetical protein